MRRRIVAMSIATAVVAAAPCAAFANVSAADQKSPTIVEKLTDARGDVVAKMGTSKDMSRGNSANAFKPGKGTAIAPSADDKAIDLRSVVYSVVRTGPKPALTITYHVKGPFSHQSKFTSDSTSFEDYETVDVFATFFTKGYNVSIFNDTKKLHAELATKSGKTQKCAGLTGTMKAHGNVATITLPLSCLTAAGVHAARLVSESMHVTEDASFTMTSDSGDESDMITVATDKVAKSRDLPLYKK